MKTKITKAFIGGMIATGAMTMMMIMAPKMGMPEMPIGKMMAEFLGIPVALGWVMHFMIGVGMSMAYVLLIYKIIPADKTLGGILFALIPFLMANLLVMPMMGKGMFFANTEMPMKMVIGSLMGHVLYGAVLGTIIGKLKSSNVKKEVFV